MTKPTVHLRPYGSWASPISAALIANGGIGLSECRFDNDNLYWLEARPADDGKRILVKLDAQNNLEDVLPNSFDVRSRVHEFGGGTYDVKNGVIVFSNVFNQRIWKSEPGTEPVPLTSKGVYRYADHCLDLKRRLVFTVREDHTFGSQEVINSIVAVSLDPSEHPGFGHVVISGRDFYSSPRVSPDGKHLVWISWNHPRMPWHGCELWIAEIDQSGNILDPKKIAGGVDESVFQPEWLPNGLLTYVSDVTGFWNLYVHDVDARSSQIMIERENDFGVSQWFFNLNTYAVVSNDLIVCTYSDKGLWRLARIAMDHSNKAYELTDIETIYTEFRSFTSDGKRVVLHAAGPEDDGAVVSLDLTDNSFSVLRSSAAPSVDPRFISKPELVTFATANGDDGYAFYYPPTNPHFIGPNDELPPLLVKSHGGPACSAFSSYNLLFQYWTSRGYAVLDVNYSGSIGFGREYRKRIDGQWGVVDVSDCELAAKHLVAEGKADLERLAITGGSSGGYTSLCALTFGQTFKAGAVHFGISDLNMIRTGTHKFGSRYPESLIGPYPEQKDLWIARSPINNMHRLAVPVIFFQGLDDRIVPPDQTEAMVKAIRQKGLPVSYIAYEDERHGFKKPENIIRTIEAEYYFVSQIFGIVPADVIEPVQIENLKITVS
ncbi:MAG TPA: prolyl oligopeptidase family serine peptidase [Drouetiella sp.]